MHSKSNLLLYALATVGVFVLNDSFVAKSAFEHLVTFSVGSLLVLLPLSVVYLRAANPHPDLKILDWVLICFVVLMMPCYEALGLDPFIWVITIFIPTLLFRILVSWYVGSWKG